MKISKLLMIAGALCLLLLFVFPMWKIMLEAPQYPDAIGMNIWVNKITGYHENDLKNINLMNHYVGMKAIPEKIPEFRFFPWIVGIMAVLGVVFGLIGNRKLYLTWFIAMSVMGLLGIYDFYLWEYDYGHNLDPTAAIKIPGQGYQPPLLGSKQILNFKAISTPLIGTYFMLTGMALVVLAYFRTKKE